MPTAPWSGPPRPTRTRAAAARTSPTPASWSPPIRPGAESVDAFHSRIAGALSDLKQRYANDDPVAIVTHGGSIRVILRMLGDGRLPLAPGQEKPEVALIGNCSIWHLIHNGDGWVIGCANDVGHLDEETAADVG